MLKDLKTGFIGAGQMSEAIFSGALKSGALLAGNLTVTDIDPNRLDALRTQYGLNTLPNDANATGAKALSANCNVIILAVKPQLAQAVLAPLADFFTPDKTVISIIGGTPLEKLEAWLPHCPIIRVMPNTPMLVGKGCAGITAGTQAGPEALALCTQLFDAVGESVLLPESLIDPLTAVSGCGPAFAYLFIEALADGGVEQGLPRHTAQRLAAQTLAGAAEMVLQTGTHPAQLKDNVCSPGGGTIAGVHALEDSAFRAAVMDAVAAACQRMKELGS